MDTAKIFQNGRSQAVRLPKSYRFEEKDVYIKKIGDLVMLIPINAVWDEFLKGLNNFSDDFMQERNQPENQVREVL